MLGTMASSTSSKKLLLLHLGRNISYFTERSRTLRRPPLQQSQHVNNDRFFASSILATAVKEPEPVKHATYGELIRNRNKPSEQLDENSSRDKKSTFTYGYIQWIDREKRFAIIREELSNERIYLHFTNIDISETAQLNAKFINPVFSRGVRVRFQTRPNQNNSEEKHAYNVERWNGIKIPLLHYKDALTIARKARALLGHICYDVLNEEQDATAMSDRIRKAYEASNKSTEWARSQLVNSNAIIKECKAELGDEVFDILENIYQIDDVRKKVDIAFFRCERMLNELELLGIRQEIKNEPR
ncbi:hypothetical protein ACHAXM_010567 [Skeletonema potamos]